MPRPIAAGGQNLRMAYAQPTTLDPTNVMGRRIGAWFIDVIVPSIAAVVIGYIVFISAATKFSGVPSDYCTIQPRPVASACIQIGNDAYVGTRDDARAAFTVGGLIYLVGALNLFVVQGITGATVGKHIVGLRVVKADGSLAGFGANAGRTLMLIVDQFFCALVGLITALVTHPHRRVGDMAAGTYVVAKPSVGTPIAVQMGTPPYPQPWTPPSQPTGWGPPPAGGTPTWGAPAPAPAPEWPRPAETPQPSSTAPPTWGAPAASPPPAETPSTWGAPASTPAATPTGETDALSPVADDSPGWAAPAPGPEAASAPEPAPVAATQAGAPAPTREPQWDAQRNAWVYWEAETSRWLQFDAATGQWGPLR